MSAGHGTRVGRHLEFRAASGTVALSGTLEIDSLIAPRHRISYIDGLRAVAVLSVVARHALEYSSVPIHGIVGALLANGRHGVDLFFVLSGFCLSYPTLRRLRSNGETAFDVVRYAAHRIVRIVPPYWAAIVFLIVFLAVLGKMGLSFTGSYALHAFSPSDLVRWACFFDLGTPILNGSFWTLPVEFRWYFLFPIVLFVWVRSPRAFLPIALLSTLIVLTGSPSPDAAFLPEFMLGIVAADMYIRKVKVPWWAPPALLSIVAFACWRQPGGATAYGLLWFPAAFGLVVCGGAFPWLSRLLSLRPLTAVGVASYSIYLTHEPLVAFMESRGLNPVIAALIAVFAGFVFWAIAERPFVETSVRTRLVAELATVLRKWLPRFGLAPTFRLRAAPPSLEASPDLATRAGASLEASPAQ